MKVALLSVLGRVLASVAATMTVFLFALTETKSNALNPIGEPMAYRAPQSQQRPSRYIAADASTTRMDQASRLVGRSSRVT